MESSKGFTRDLLEKYGIDASPKFTVFDSQKNSKRALDMEKDMYTFIDQELGSNYVVKYDALSRLPRSQSFTGMVLHNSFVYFIECKGRSFQNGVWYRYINRTIKRDRC